MDQRSKLYDDSTSEVEPEKKWKISGAARHVVGLILLLCVVMLWTLQNFLASSILANDSYAKPFFLNYLNTGSFAINLTPMLVRGISKGYKNGTLRSSVRSFFSKRTIKAFLRKESDLEASQFSERSALLKPGNGHHALSASATLNAANTFHSNQNDTKERLDLIPTARLSVGFCLIWFAANYFSSASLQWTTVSSCAIISATCSIWCLLIGTITRTESFTWRKFIGVMFAMSGVILISRLDLLSGSTDEPDSPPGPNYPHHNLTIAASPNFDTFPDKTVAEVALGDFVALLGAVAYGMYTITLKRAELTAYPKEVHMPTFFGFVGLFNLILLLPIFPILHYTGIEPFAFPPTTYVWGILLINTVSCYVGDQTWAYAMLFTSPLVCTVGLSLNIPLSLVGETVLQGESKGLMYWVGGMIVVLGFIFVEREVVKEEKEAVEEYCRSLEASMVLGGDAVFAEYDSSDEPDPPRTVRYGAISEEVAGPSSAYTKNAP